MNRLSWKIPVQKDAAGLRQILYAPTAADDQLAKIDPFEGDFVDKVIALREREKRVQQRRSCSTLRYDLSESIAIILFSTMPVERQLCRGKHDCNRRSKIMRSICRKLAEP